MKKSNMLLTFTIIIFAVLIFSLIKAPNNISEPEIPVITKESVRDIPPITLKEEKIFNELTQQEEYVYTKVDPEELDKVIYEEPEEPEEQEQDGNRMYSTGPVDDDEGVIGCKEASCNYYCTRRTFDEGRCLSNACYCLNKLPESCTVQSCDDSCPGTGFCDTSSGQCFCEGEDITTHSCRQFGNTQIFELGALFYDRETQVLNAQEENICYGNSLIKFHCLKNEHSYLTAEQYEEENSFSNTERALINYTFEDCSKLSCTKYKSGVCSVNQCICKYVIDKEFLKDAINKYLLDLDSSITEEDIALLIKAYLGEESLTTEEETELDAVIDLVNYELSNEHSMQVDYDILY